MNYICDCMGNKDKDKNKIYQGRGIFGHTKVYSDGTCKHCGHYAVQFKTLGYNRGKPTVFASLVLLYGTDINRHKRIITDPLYIGTRS